MSGTLKNRSTGEMMYLNNIAMNNIPDTTYESNVSDVTWNFDVADISTEIQG